MMTKTINNSWRILLLLALFSVQCSVFNEIRAQQAVQDALYIFRNDGQFNAFFFNDIERMEYSNVDTMGFVHEAYVTQEIYAMDSLFRIPLSAIDSVSFVTPENKYRDDIYVMDDWLISFTNYVEVKENCVAMTLYQNYPKSLPAVGTIMVSDPNKFFPEGFLGKLTLVETPRPYAQRFYLELEPITISDPREVYDVLVLKGSTAGTGNANNARRKAGPNPDWSYESPDPISLPAVSGSLSLASGNYTMTDKGFPIQLSVDGSVDLSVQLQSDVDLRCFLYLNALYGQDRFYQIAKFKNNVDVSLGVTGAVTAHVDLPFTFTKDVVKNGLFLALKEGGNKLTTKVGAFMVDFSFGLYFEGQTTSNISYVWSNKHQLNTTLQVDKSSFLSDWEYFYHFTPVPESNTTQWSMSFGKINLSTGIYAQAEAKASIFGYSVDVTARGDAGLKVELDAPIGPKVGDALLGTSNIYKLANMDNILTISTPANLGASLTRTGKAAWTPKFSGAFSEPITYGIVPNIFGITCKRDAKRLYRHTIESPFTRHLLWPVSCGFAVFNEDNLQVEDWWRETAYQNDIVFKSYSNRFEYLDPLPNKATVYTVYPQIKYGTFPILTDQKVEVKIDKAYINISEKTITTNEETGYKELGFVPNMKNIEIKSDSEWLTFTHLDAEGTLTLFWEDMPEAINSRTGKILVAGKNKKGDVLVRDTIVVKQVRDGFIPITSDMKFLGTWSDEYPNSQSYYTYYFGGDGTYRYDYDTPSSKYTCVGTYYIISYEKPTEGDYCMITKIHVDYVRHQEGKPDKEYSEDKTLKLWKDGKWLKPTLQIGTNTYNPKE